MARITGLSLTNPGFAKSILGAVAKRTGLHVGSAFQMEWMEQKVMAAVAKPRTYRLSNQVSTALTKNDIWILRCLATAFDEGPALAWLPEDGLHKIVVKRTVLEAHVTKLLSLECIASSARGSPTSPNHRRTMFSRC
jgi:hypothetical protein